MLAHPALAQTPATFGTVTIYSTGTNSHPYSIAVADVNGDGNPDLLTANLDGNTAGVKLGNGNGTFGPVTAYSTGTNSNPYSIAVADVNGDGKPDLLTANENTNTAGVLLGNGNGTFGTVTSYGTGTNSGPRSIAVADVNGDGRPDLLTANFTTRTAGVLLGNGNGTFGTVTTYGTGTNSNPTGIAVADVNGDGKPDLLTANFNTSTAGVLLGTGTGTFGAVTAYSTGTNSRSSSIAVADVNSDGKPDLLTANPGSDTAGVLLGTGTGTFGTVTTYSTGTGSQPYGIAVADVNSDGRLDLLSANYSSSTAGVLLGTGTGTFGAVTAYSTGTNSNLYNLAVADVNGDGRPDLLTANSRSNAAGVLLNTTPVATPRIFMPVVTYSTGANGSPYGIAVADVNGDGRPDLLTANYGTNSAGVQLGTGTGTFGAVTSYSTGANSYPFSIAVADVNGDGRPDLLTTNVGSSSAGVLLGTGTGTFGAVTSYSIGANSSPHSIAVADVNGDGQPDLLTANSNNNSAGVLLGTGTGTFGAVTNYSTGANSHPVSIAVADVNGDGRPDLLTANSNNNSAGVLLGMGTGTFGAVTSYSTGAGSQPVGMAVTDVNGDGQPDLLTANSSSSTAGVLLGTGTGTFGAVTTYSTGTGSQPYGIAVADVNGDGRPDLLTANYAGSTAGVLLGTGAGTFGTVTSYSTGASSSPFAIAVADVNGDGQPDLLMADPTTSSAAVLLGAVFTAPPDLVISTPGQAIAAGPYNSITVQNGGTGTLAGNVSVVTSTSVNDGGTFNDGSFVLSGAGSFALAAGGTLGICNTAGITTAPTTTGAIQNTGTRTFSIDASYTYNGTAAQVTGTGLPIQVRNLSTTNASADVTLTSHTSVVQVLTVGATGNLATGGQALTLLSSATGTALLVNSSTGTVTGAATVQRYIDPSLNSGDGYRHYAPPVANTTVADLAAIGFAPVVNDAYNTAAIPTAVTPFPTVFGYDQARVSHTNSSPAFDKGFFSPVSQNTPLAVGQGYAVQIGAAPLVDFVGTLNQNATYPLHVTRNATGTPNAADAGWQLLGNPYPSPLDCSLITLADLGGLDASFYVVQSAGPYTGAYRAFVNGVPTTNKLMTSSQAFFVHSSTPGSTGTFTFRTAQRVTSYATQTAFSRPTADPRPLVQLDLRATSLSTGPADTFYAYAEAGATTAFDSRYDALKLPNSTGLNLAGIAASGQPLAIDGRPAFTPTTAIALTVGVPAAGTYTLAATGLTNLPTGLEAYLHDADTGLTTRLTAGGRISFRVTTAQAAAIIAGRFSLQFNSQSPLAATAGRSMAPVTVFPNPAHGGFTALVPAVAGATMVQADLLNTLGQVVSRQRAALPPAGDRLAVTTAGLAPGSYVLRLTAGTSVLIQRVVLY